MCECATCGTYAPCGDPSCTNSECPDCQELREQQAFDADAEACEDETEGSADYRVGFGRHL